MQFKLSVINFTGKIIGDTYVEETRLSLVRCNHYVITEDSTSIGTFLSACRHSGEKYFSFTLYGESLTIKARRKSLFRNHYQILQNNDSKLIGYFEYSNWEWKNKIDGKMVLANGETYHFREVFSRITRVWPKKQKFEMRSDTIKYSGELKIDESFDALFTGIITTEGKPQTVSAVLGIFFIDKKFRKWVQDNVD